MNFNSHHNQHGRPNIPAPGSFCPPPPQSGYGPNFAPPAYPTPGGYCPPPPSAFPSDHHHMPPHSDFCPPPPAYPTPGGYCPPPPSAFPSDHHHMPPHSDFCPPPPPAHHHHGHH